MSVLLSTSSSHAILIMLKSYQKQQVLSQTYSVRVIDICGDNHYVIKFSG